MTFDRDTVKTLLFGVTRVQMSILLYFFFSFFFLPMDLIITILPVVTKIFPSLPGFTPYIFFYRDASSALLQLVNHWLNLLYLLTFPRFPLRKKEHKSYFGKNRTHDFRTSRGAGYLLDHSGDARTVLLILIYCCRGGRDSLD